MKIQLKLKYGVLKTVPIKMQTEQVFFKYCRNKIGINRQKLTKYIHLNCNKDVELFKDVFAYNKDVLEQIASTIHLVQKFGNGNSNRIDFVIL